MSKPRIAFLSHGDPAAEVGVEEAGGQNVYVRRTGEYLARLGWQVDMFTRRVDEKAASIVQHLPTCRTIRLDFGPKTFIPSDEMFGHMAEFVRAFRQFQSNQCFTYPLIHTHYWLSGWVGLHSKEDGDVQMVHTYHSLGAAKYQYTSSLPPISETRLSVERRILEQSDCVVATSPHEREEIRLLVSLRGRINVIPCGADTNNFRLISKREARHKLKLNQEAPIVLFVGRFDPRKGIETVVRSCARSQTCKHTDFHLLIVGGSTSEGIDGQERKRIEQIVLEQELTDHTTFAGRIDHDLLPFYYAAADVCMIPSLYEPFGMVAIEAMACGTPVIAAATGGLRSTVVPNKTGLLVPPEDEIAFSNAIDQIINNKMWAQYLGEQGSILVRNNFSWNVIASRLGNLYEELLCH